MKLGGIKLRGNEAKGGLKPKEEMKVRERR